MITRPWLMKTKLPIFAFVQAILHVASLVQIRPIAYHKNSPMQLVCGQQPNVSHF